MKILFISNEYPPDTGYGGIGTYTKYAAEGLYALGHTVSVITRAENSPAYTAISNGVFIDRITPLPYPLPQFRHAYPVRRLIRHCFPHVLDRLSWSKAVGKRLSDTVRKTGPYDIIEAPDCGAEALYMPRDSNRRFILRLHTPWEIIRELNKIKEPPGDYFTLPFIERLTASRADAVSAPSKAVADIMRRKWRLDNVTVIPNPLPVSTFTRTSGNVWIYTGRIERRKGVLMLIKAYANVRRRREAPPLVLVGRPYERGCDDHEYVKAVETAMTECSAFADIRWIKGASLDTVAGHLQSACVAFFPSIWENFPYSCLEAMASGCTVVATRCGGFAEIIEHEKNGLLVEPNSVSSIENAMHYLLDNPSRIRKTGDAARKTIAEKVSSESVCRDIEQFYHSTLKRADK